jgi:hypothetical protein
MDEPKSLPLAQNRQPYRGPWPPPQAVTSVTLSDDQIAICADLLLNVLAKQLPS